jgi:hypothetical protein
VFVAEQILNIFHGGLGNPTPFKKLPCISFEILGKNQTLSYLFRIQSEYADFFVQQLYAHYSGIVVEAIEPPLPEDTPLYIQENRLKE